MRPRGCEDVRSVAEERAGQDTPRERGSNLPPAGELMSKLVASFVKMSANGYQDRELHMNQLEKSFWKHLGQHCSIFEKCSPSNKQGEGGDLLVFLI